MFIISQYLWIKNPAWLSCSLYSGSHKGRAGVRDSLHSHLKLRLLFQADAVCLQNLDPCGCRTETLSSQTLPLPTGSYTTASCFSQEQKESIFDFDFLCSLESKWSSDLVS